MLNSGTIFLALALVVSAMALWRPSMTRDRRIVRGHDASRTNHGFMVSLQNATCLTSLRWYCTWKHFCGGTLIDGKWVLTAASCLYIVKEPGKYSLMEKSDIRVVLGATDLESDEEHRQLRTVKQIIIHEKFEMTNSHVTKKVHLKNNIALLELSSNATLTQLYVQVARLTKETFKTLEDCKAMGWGRTLVDAPVTSYLQEVDMRTFDNPTCKRDYNDQVTDQEVCAMGKRDPPSAPQAISCLGDQGGPLSCLDGVKAIASGGHCHSRVQGPITNIYTRVRPYKDWIMETTGLRNLFDN